MKYKVYNYQHQHLSFNKHIVFASSEVEEDSVFKMKWSPLARNCTFCRSHYKFIDFFGFLEVENAHLGQQKGACNMKLWGYPIARK